MADDLSFMSATELARHLRSRDVTALEVTDAFLRRIDDHNHETRSFVTVTHDLALETATRCDAAAQRGTFLGPLHGIPIGIKDLFDLRSGVRNTFGSLPLADFVPTETTPYISRLEAAGAVIVGKTNAPEFGHKGITDNFVTGPTSTPFDLTRNSGGSSGGSAAAVGAGLVPLAQGTDGGGSLRIPAAWCGVFGYKPSFGRVPDPTRPDSAAATNPFISAGPIARSVADAALMLSVMAGPHPRDVFSLAEHPGPWLQDASVLNGSRIAFIPDFGGFPVESAIIESVSTAVRVFEQAGASVEQVEFRLPADQSELSALWRRMSGVMYGTVLETVKAWGTDLIGDHAEDLTPAFRDMVVEAQGLSVHDMRRDAVLRTAVQDCLQDVLDEYDFIVTPTLATGPVVNGSPGTTMGPSQVNGESVDPSIGWCLTYPVNFAGNPAASIPGGLTSDGLPVGMQIVGRRQADSAVLTASSAFEAMSPWAATYPGVRG
jgi:amidase/aspartyl-tRNA(Asn)/glutamyl-tRNA(Gln) amidotransferase subunit A